MENEEIAGKYGLNLESLKQEQLKLAKGLSIKDSIDFSSSIRFAGVDAVIVKNQIIGVVIVCDKEFNILDQQYFIDKLRFPYIYGFRSYREIPAIVEAFNKLQEKPDLVFISGPGIIHPRLGLASHFSIITGVPSIGIADNVFEENKIEGEDVLKEGKVAGKVFLSKLGSTPIYVSPGDKISIKTSLDISKSFIRPPHKLPEPLNLAHKYSKSVRKELNLK